MAATPITAAAAGPFVCAAPAVETTDGPVVEALIGATDLVVVVLGTVVSTEEVFVLVEETVPGGVTETTVLL